MAAVGQAILNNTLLPPGSTRRWMEPATVPRQLVAALEDGAACGQVI
jgi:hypothetical protein